MVVIASVFTVLVVLCLIVVIYLSFCKKKYDEQKREGLKSVTSLLTVIATIIAAFSGSSAVITNEITNLNASFASASASSNSNTAVSAYTNIFVV